MDETKQMIYSEVYSVLNMLGNNYIKKLPLKLYKQIESQKSDTYNPTYDGTIALEQQNIKRESISMIALLHLNYWCENEAEKEELRSIFRENENKYQNNLKEKYNSNNIFNKNVPKEPTKEVIIEEGTIQEEQPTSEIKNEVAMVEYKESIFKKFINKIKKIFTRKKCS